MSSGDGELDESGNHEAIRSPLVEPYLAGTSADEVGTQIHPMNR